MGQFAFRPSRQGFPIVVSKDSLQFIIDSAAQTSFASASNLWCFVVSLPRHSAIASRTTSGSLQTKTPSQEGKSIFATVVIQIPKRRKSNRIMPGAGRMQRNKKVTC